MIWWLIGGGLVLGILACLAGARIAWIARGIWDREKAVVDGDEADGAGEAQ